MQEDDKAAVDALENSQIQAVTAFIRGNAVPPGDQGPRSVCYHRWMKLCGIHHAKINLESFTLAKVMAIAFDHRYSICC